MDPEIEIPDLPEDSIIWYENFGPSSEGKTSAVVLNMNHYSDIRDCFIPAEIGLAAFSMDKGLIDVEWTFIDPVSMPMGFTMHALDNIERYGVPKPNFSPKYQNYAEIVSKLEKFLKKYLVEVAGQTFIVCFEENVGIYTKSLNWLYKKGGLEGFPHEIRSIEGLIVTISLTGLAHMTEDNNTDLNNALKNVSKLIDMIKRKGAESRKVKKRFESFKSRYNKTEDHYTFTGRTVRIANQDVYKNTHPSANLGVFLFFKDVNTYLKCTAYQERKNLGCPYHQEDPEFFQKWTREWRSKNPYSVEDENRPLNRLHRCALLLSIQQVYLAVDSMLVNYPKIEARVGMHYPPSEEEVAKAMDKIKNLRLTSAPLNKKPEN